MYVTTIFAGAFAFGVGFDLGVTSFWDRWNQGVRIILDFVPGLAAYPISQKQWKDIRQKYVEAAED